MSGSDRETLDECVCQIGDVLEPLFKIPNAFQQGLTFTVRNRANQVDADRLLKTGRWVIKEKAPRPHAVMVRFEKDCDCDCGQSHGYCILCGKVWKKTKTWPVTPQSADPATEPPATPVGDG